MGTPGVLGRWEHAWRGAAVMARAMLRLITAKLGESTQPPLHWWGKVPRGRGDGPAPL